MNIKRYLILLAFITLSVAFLDQPTHSASPIHLKSRIIDTGKPEELRPQKVFEPGETAYYIVQGLGRNPKRLKSAAASSGARVISYLPDDSFLIEIQPGRINRLRNMKSVRWFGRYKPEYRISPVLKAAIESGERPEWITILLSRGPRLKRSLLELARLGVRPVELSIGKKFCYLKVRLDPRLDPSRIVLVEPVLWIEPWKPLRLIASPPTITGDVPADIMNLEEVWSEGIDGAGQVLGICDTGLDVGIDGPPIHDDFEGRLVSAYALGRPSDWSDDHGHGTHVAGTAVGDGSMSSGLYRGAAYGSLLVFQSAYVDENDPLGGLTTDLYPLFEQAYNDGARIHSNSWGSPDRGRYSIYSEQVDRFMWDHPDMLLVFAAGNDGVDDDSNGVIDQDSLYSPASAKNCLAVGASENLRFSGGLSGYTWGLIGLLDGNYQAEPVYSDLISDYEDGLAAFSSRGPCDDGRIKPDITAPGTDIISCRTQDPTGFSMASLNTWGIYDDYYVYMGGTSMAAPAVSGSAALARQFLVEREGIVNPSAALIKAALVTGAYDMDPGQYGAGSTREMTARPNNAEGWGRVDLYNSLFATAQTEIEFIDQSPGLDDGETVVWQFAVGDPTVPFRCTLAYTDYPGNPAAAIQLVNDLDLVVTSPLGANYYPNRLGKADRLNNMETIDIDQPFPGVYRIEISGYNVPFGPQPFALVVHYGRSSSMGRITLNKQAFGVEDGAATVTVIDNDLSGAGTVEVHLCSTSDGVGETITLTESTSTPGIFAGPVLLTTLTPGPGEIGVADSDTVTALYHDQDQGDGSPSDVSFTASIDLIYPVISSLAVNSVGVDEAEIQWGTSEPCNATIVFGQKLPLTETAGAASYSLSRTIPLADLQQNTRYYFKVESSDPAGNLVIDDNGGALYTFATRYGSVLFSDDMENGQGGWTHSGDFDQWELGVPTYLLGPASAYSPDNCWGTNLDSWFQHDDFFYGSQILETLISPPIYIDQSTGLTYWYWYELVADQDYMYVEISADGGPWITEDTFQGSTFGQWYQGFINLSSYVNKTIRIRFQIWADTWFDDFDPHAGWYIDDVMITSYKDYGVGAVSFDRQSYGINTPVIITVIDGNENPDPDSFDTVTATVSSAAETAGETITLTETELNSGIFQAAFDITTAIVAGDGKLGVSSGDQISGEYLDLDDGAGSYNVVRSATADVDLAGPSLGSLNVGNVSSSAAQVTFVSEPNSTAVLKYGAGGELVNELEQYSLNGAYAFDLQELDDNTLYSFAIIIEDESGNTVTFDSPMNEYRFGTLAARTYAFNTFDTETYALNFTSDNSIWELGVPELGPGAAFSAPNCWATDLDGPYPINCDAAITSGWVSLAPDSFLGFQHWYSINEYLLEDAYGVVEVSVNGTDWTDITPDPLGYVGASAGWIGEKINLASYGGQDVMLRFRLYSQESDIVLYYYEGWYVDDAALTQEIDYGKGSLFFDRNVYSLNTTVQITLIDAHLNSSPESAETFTLTVSSLQESLEAEFTETALNSGKFTAIISLDDSAPQTDGLLQVDTADTISITYSDADNGSGVPADVIAQAPVDLIYPVISGVSFSDPTDTAVAISWFTNEPCIGRIYIGKTPIENSGQVISGSASYTTSHSIVLSDLDENTCYYIKLTSEDQAANRTTDDNSGLLYKVFTKVRKELFLDDFDRDEKGWTHSGTGDEWEKGTPNYGIAYAASAPNCWATDLDGDYPGTVDAALTSPAVEIETGTRLSFKHWYNIEEYGLDNGTGLVEVSPNGSTWNDISGGGYSGKAGSGWRTETLSLSGYNPGRINVRYRLNADQTIEFYYPGWYIDDVSLYVLEPYGYGVLMLDRLTYTVVDSVQIRLKDGHLNLDPTVIETAAVAVSSSSDTLPHTVVLVESDNASGIFSGTVAISEFSGADVLTASDGDTILVAYTDADNADGGLDVIITAQAMVSIIDTDGDSLPNAWEERYGLDPNSATGNQGRDGDLDTDTLTNYEEYGYKTNPKKFDTDFDGLDDGAEIRYELDPLDPESFLKIIAIDLNAIDGTATITWSRAAHKQYEIFWTDEMYTATAWDRVDGPALDDIIDNGDGTISWTDRGADPDMLGLGPGDVYGRFYKVSGSSIVEVLSLRHDPITGFVQIVWNDIPGKTFKIYWSNLLDLQPQWDEVDGPALGNLTDHGDTWSWTDKGIDPDMGAQGLAGTETRFYKIFAQ